MFIVHPSTKSRQNDHETGKERVVQTRIQKSQTANTTLSPIFWRSHSFLSLNASSKEDVKYDDTKGRVNIRTGRHRTVAYERLLFLGKELILSTNYRM